MPAPAPSVVDYSKERYAAIGVDVEAALKQLADVPISIHCWQGDDIGGFDSGHGELGAGLAVTGNYPGKARTWDELRQDIEQVYSLLPGTHRLNLHAIYGNYSGPPVDRDGIGIEHFRHWLEWAQSQGVGLDFNPSCFGHPLAEDGFTLSHPDRGRREFWIEHCKRSRLIGAEFGRSLGTPCVTNIWVPDGMKDTPVDRAGYRQRLAKSLDEIFSDASVRGHNIDAVESKLFGIGSESMVVGSHEFYFGYAIKAQTALCLDAGHFHPTESIADKVSSVLMYVPRLLLHVSRGVRWDSDHVVLLDDPTRSIMQELVRSDALPRTHVGLDFFDASINRIAAWVIGTRAVQKSLLMALLEPRQRLLEMERSGDYTARLATLEELKSMPWGVIWEHFCDRAGVPGEMELLRSIKNYEDEVLSRR